MAKKNKKRPGYAKLLDAWAPPDDAGNPVGCVATTFTFAPEFFEDECLSRFLQLETDAQEDGPFYLVEREEKLSQVVCAAALVDQHHCKGGRSLRWDMLCARLDRGVQHAKISLLCWSNLVRLIIASANLTGDGYRRNQEVFGVLDYEPNGDAPLQCLKETVQYLRDLAQTAGAGAAEERWNELLGTVLKKSSSWGNTEQPRASKATQVFTVLSGPGRRSVIDQLETLWPDSTAPDTASVVSPFFDDSPKKNFPAEKLWGLMSKKGEATVEYDVVAEKDEDSKIVSLSAPKSLLEAEPKRDSASTEWGILELEDGRPLHAKCIWLNNQRHIAYMIGSSNFTTPGLGIGKTRNYEANLLYVAKWQKNKKLWSGLEHAYPCFDRIHKGYEVCWNAQSDDGDDTASEDTVLLPQGFSDALFTSDPKHGQRIRLAFGADVPSGWEVLYEDAPTVLYTEALWGAQHRPESVALAWQADRPPSGFRVRWTGSGGDAWWPVNVESATDLPPPEQLRDLPLEVLIEILSSARPLHIALRKWLKSSGQSVEISYDSVIDPHKRVDTSAFLLQRMRRVSCAFRAMGERLSRPVSTLACLEWRLSGPVGVKALVTAINRDENRADERAFFLAELLLELARVKPETGKGCLPAARVRKEIMRVIHELRAEMPSLDGQPENLAKYVKDVFRAVGT